MFELLLYSGISCKDASQIIERAKKNEELSNLIKQEIVLTIEEATPECPWDAND
jgi:hypothetical protein